MNTTPPSTAFHAVVLKRDRLSGDFIGRVIRELWPQASVDVFDRGREALKAMQLRVPDLFVTGVMIEDMDGLEHLEPFVERTCPVLIVTSVPYVRMFVSVRPLRFDGIYDAAEGIENLPQAIKAAVEHRPYYSPGFAERLRPRRSVMRELTPREQIIVSALADGASDKELAELMSISVQTAKTHRKLIMRKLGLRHKGQLFVFACQQGYLYVTPNGVFRPGFQRYIEDLKRKSAQLAGACEAACQCVKEAALSYFTNRIADRARP